jgi:uncharacterized protein YbjT (DUF2867 family)
MSTKRVAVAGGTGVVGRHVVDALRAAGHEAVVLARSTGVDLVSGHELAGALGGADAVVDVVNGPVMSRAKSVGFFDHTTRNLLAAERHVGVRHHLVLSIVGIDRVDFGYYFGKRRQEALVRAGDIPWTILRATQFHEFAGQILDRVRGPVVPVPTMRTQPVAAREVGARLAELAVGEPAGMTQELAGPEVFEMPDLVRRVLRARGSRRLVLPVRIPGAVGRAMAGGGVLPTGDAMLGKQRFEEWLADSRARR